MRAMHTCALILALSTAALPAFAQQSASADPAAASVDYVALREGLSNQNKALTGDVIAERTIVKRNQDLLKEENANLEKQRAALAASQSDTASATSK
jgi:hypothetical protein